MTHDDAIKWLNDLLKSDLDMPQYEDAIKAAIEECERAEQQTRLWNNHQVACLLADMFGDSCACNYNGIDEWLPELCDFKDTCCPNPVGVACWEQFLKHTKSRYCECDYEMR